MKRPVCQPPGNQIANLQQQQMKSVMRCCGEGKEVQSISGGVGHITEPATADVNKPSNISLSSK